MSSRTYLTKLSLVFFIFFIFLTKSFSIEPDIFVQSTVDKASAALSDNFSKEEKIIKLKIIAKDTVDIKGIGLYTLGNHRKNMANDKKNEYLNIFEEYFLKTFSDRLAEYANPEVQVVSTQKLNKNYTIVSSYFNCNGKETRS